MLLHITVLSAPLISRLSLCAGGRHMSTTTGEDAAHVTTGESSPLHFGCYPIQIRYNFVTPWSHL